MIFLKLFLNIIVQVELPWVWPEVHCVDFLVLFNVDEHVKQVRSKHAAFSEESVIAFEARDALLQRAWQLFDLAFAFVFIDVVIHRFAGVDFFLYSV